MNSKKDTQILNRFFIANFLILFSFFYLFNVTSSNAQDTLKTNVVKIVANHEFGKEYGAGLVIGSDDENLYILTVWHVINGLEAQAIEVSFFKDPNSYNVNQIEQYYVNLDIAIITVKKTDREFITFQIYEEIEMGQEVSVIGHPYGNDWRINIPANIIIDHLYNNDVRMLSVNNVGIRPGNSGGVIYSKDKKLIGMILRATSLEAVAIKLSGILPVIVEKWDIPVNLIEFNSKKNKSSSQCEVSLDCKEAGTGVMEIINQTQRKKFIRIYGSQVPLYPKESRCFYDLKEGTGNFWLYDSDDQGKSGKYYDHLSISIRTCEVTTYSINH